MLDSGMCHITCDGRNGICLCVRWDNPTNFRLTTYRSRLTKASEVMQRLLGNAWEGLKLTWPEWHSIVIGWGDGVAFTKTDWLLVGVFYGEEEKMEQEFQ